MGWPEECYSLRAAPRGLARAQLIAIPCRINRGHKPSTAEYPANLSIHSTVIGLSVKFALRRY